MAAVRCKYVRQTMTAYLEGEIDHHSAQSLREEIDAQILSMTPVKLVLDFGGVTFTDSSGIGRNTMMKVLGGKMAIQNPPVQMVRILRLAQIPVEIMQEVTMR